MQILESWLREWVNPSLDTEALAELLTLAGIEVEEILPYQLAGKKDALFVFKITPNRGDCLSIKGLAREVSALTQTPCCAPVIMPTLEQYPTPLTVHIDAPHACSCYIGRLIRGIDPSLATIPDWMIARLTASGFSPTSTIVDIGNYVMLELGQPLHLFDAATIQGDIRVRTAQSGEQLLCLNQQKVALDTNMLVVADDQQPLALAGIMGGLASCVTPATCDIFLESAYFYPQVIANKARLLGFTSEAAYRFERGIDMALQTIALERATELIVAIFGGEVGSVVVAHGSTSFKPAINLRTERVEQLLGVAITEETIANSLKRLSLDFTHQANIFTVKVPSFRGDLAIEEDLIEEVARLYGYDNIPTLSPVAYPHILLQRDNVSQERGLRHLLVARGYQEVIHYPFVPEVLEKRFSTCTTPIKLLNPIDSEAGLMRSTLLGGLVEHLARNIDRQQSRVRCFEIANTFYWQDNQDCYQTNLALLAWGARYPEQWGCAALPVDFYDMKQDVEVLIGREVVQFVETKHPALHQGRAAQIQLKQEVVGVIGELAPHLVQQYALPAAPILCEIHLAALHKELLPLVRTIAKFPFVRRDLALVVDKRISAQELSDVLHRHAPSIVQSIRLFDVYHGQGIPSGKKSMAYHILLQAPNKTLTEREINAALDTLYQAACTMGAYLRE